MERPKIVCLCGSTRFKEAWYEQTKLETYAGKIVLGVGDLNPNAPGTNVPLDPELKARLDELHLRKIDLADEVLVLNCKRDRCDRCNAWLDEPGHECQGWAGSSMPYVGESTRREIAYALARGKPVRYLNPLS